MGLLPRAELVGRLLFVPLVQAQELLSWTCHVGPIPFLPCTEEAGKRAMGHGWKRAVSMMVLDPSPLPEMALQPSLGTAALACADMEQKPWGLAALQPAARGSKITVCCHSPRRDVDAWLGCRNSGEAGLLLHVCLSVCSEGVAGSMVSGTAQPCSEAAAGVCQGSRAVDTSRRARASALTQP